jgi:hypothetical protein
MDIKLVVIQVQSNACCPEFAILGKAFNKEFYTNIKPRTEHINIISMSGNMNNNKMERFNGEVRDREKSYERIKEKRYIYSNWLSNIS